MQSFTLEKLILSQTDFDEMSWHDCFIYATAFRCHKSEFVLDIDYICKWAEPTLPEDFYRKWIAPATLVFENVVSLNFSFDYYGDSCEGLEIDSILRDEISPEKRKARKDLPTNLWIIECHDGDIELESSGFKQYFRTPPSLEDGRYLGLEKRGGYSFSTEQKF